MKWLIDVPTQILYRFGALVALPLVAATVAYGVIARYVFHAPLQGGDEISGLLLLVFYMAAIPMVTNSDGHIRMETLYENFSYRGRQIADILGALCGSVFLGLLAYAEWSELPGTYRRGDGAQMIDIPYWPITLFVALCATFVTLLLLVNAARAFKRATIGGGKQ
jgi:TRAP-type C4-dicarboxylate transport system permease small subunit